MAKAKVTKTTKKRVRKWLKADTVYEPLAEEFELSVRYTKTIVYKGEEKIFKHI